MIPFMIVLIIAVIYIGYLLLNSNPNWLPLGISFLLVILATVIVLSINYNIDKRIGTLTDVFSQYDTSIADINGEMDLLTAQDEVNTKNIAYLLKHRHTGIYGKITGLNEKEITGDE